MSKIKFNDVQFIPSADCSCYEECIEDAYNQALEDLLKAMKERADDCADIPNMFDRGYYQAYEHMCYEAEQLKEQNK